MASKACYGDAFSMSENEVQILMNAKKIKQERPRFILSDL